MSDTIFLCLCSLKCKLHAHLFHLCTEDGAIAYDKYYISILYTEVTEFSHNSILNVFQTNRMRILTFFKKTTTPCVKLDTLTFNSDCNLLLNYLIDFEKLKISMKTDLITKVPHYLLLQNTKLVFKQLKMYPFFNITINIYSQIFPYMYKCILVYI